MTHWHHLSLSKINNRHCTSRILWEGSDPLCQYLGGCVSYSLAGDFSLRTTAVSILTEESYLDEWNAVGYFSSWTWSNFHFVGRSHGSTGALESLIAAPWFELFAKANYSFGHSIFCDWIVAIDYSESVDIDYSESSLFPQFHFHLKCSSKLWGWTLASIRIAFKSTIQASPSLFVPKYSLNWLLNFLMLLI